MSFQKKQSCLVLLMIAHEGVTQPNLWRLWQTTTQDHQIHYAVIAPETPKYGSAFCNRNRITTMKQTSWGSFSIVYETIRGLCTVLDKFPDVDRVCIVSGYDIPIHNLSHWLGIHRKHVELVGKINFGRFFMHSQWMCLTKPFLQHLCQYFGWKHGIFSETSTMMNVFLQSIRLLVRNTTFQNMAPDEVWLNFIDYPEQKFSNRTIVLPYYHDFKNRVSPIEWNFFTLPEYIEYALF